ncbi:MAG: ABC transporter substrate-binding protein [Candidatus Gastranaerophilaceae bacterium]
MKKILYLALIIIFVLFAGKSCINKDVPEIVEVKNNLGGNSTRVEFPPTAKTVTINGVDYLQSQAPVGNFGGVLVSSTIGEGPKTFNPFNTKDATSATMTGMMFDGLVSTKPDTGEVIPRLAKSFEISPDGKIYTIKLRHGIKWSDGKPITADDVIFSWNKILLAGLGNTSTRDSVVIDGQLPKVEKIDDYTVKFTTIKPFAPFLRTLSAPIAPKHIFEPIVKKGPKYFDSFWSTTARPENFVISGPFKLKEYSAAQRIVFERNPNYYEINLKGEKLPYLDKVIYLIVGDLNNEILKFEARELDIISLRGSNVGRYKKKEAKSDFVIYNIGPDTGTMFVIVNMNKRKNEQGKYYVDPKKQVWFNDKNFRYAIDWAIDRKNMVNNIANGLASPLFTAESLNSIYLNKKLAQGHPKNINEAKKYLKKSGFYWKKGVLYDKFNNRVEFDLYTNAGNTEREAIGVMVKQDLEDLGMKVNFKPIEFNTLVNKMVNTLDWDLVIMGLTGTPLEPHDGKNVWYSTGSLHLFNQRQSKDGGIKPDDRFPWEVKLDKIIDEASLKITFKDRKKLYDEYQQVIYDEKPIIYLYSPIRVVAVRKKFGNIYPSPLAGVAYNLDEIYIKGNGKQETGNR